MIRYQRYYFLSLLLLVFIGCKNENQSDSKDSEVFKYPKSNDSLENWYNDKSLADTTRMQALFLLGINNLSGNIDTALIIAKKLLEESTQLKLRVFIGKAYSLAGSASLNLNQRDTALILYKEGLRVRLKEKDFKRAAESYNQIGYFYYSDSKTDSALKYYNLALSIHKDLKNDAGIAHMNKNIGDVYLFLSDYDKSLKCYLEAKKFHEKTKNIKNIGASYVSLGNVYYMKTDVRKALDNYLKALKLNEKLNNKVHAAAILGNIGVVYLDLGDYDEVIRYQKKSLKLERELKSFSGMASCYSNIGLAYEYKKDYKKSLDNLKEAMKIYAEIEDEFGMAQTKVTIGSVYIRLKKYDEAMKYEKEAIEVFDKLGVVHYAAIAHCNLAHINLGLKDLSKVEFHAKKSLELAEEAELADTKRDALEILADYYYNVNNPNEAYKYQKQFIALKDSLSNTQIKNEITRKDINFEYQKRMSEDSLQNAEKVKQEKIHHEIEIANQKIYTYIGVGGFLLMLFVAVVSVRAYRQKKQSEKIISLQKEIVEDKQKKITDSINYAKRIQYSLLAHKDLLSKNLPEYFVLFQPKAIVSGDFYWGTSAKASVPNGQDNFYLAVCDSTGHGVPGAFMSLLNISFLNEAINEKNIHSSNEVLNHVRQRLIQNMEGSYDGMDATLIKFEKNRIEYASANNKPVLIRENKLVELNEDKMPVGYGSDMSSFNLYSLDLLKGDNLYFFTDGYADQFGGPKGKKFKYSTLHKLLLEISKFPIGEQEKILVQRFEEWKGNLEQIDDVCIIGIRI